jgi:predicted nucleotidyltransferase
METTHERRVVDATRVAPTAEAVVAALRAHEAELRAAGIARLTLFGSVARGEAGPESDVDLHAELDPEARIGWFALADIVDRLEQIVGRKVDLLTGRIRRPRLLANFERDRLDAL